jgi:hypothetical protein
MKVKFYKYIIALSAFLISGTAAFFSVYGISSLFAGAKLSVGIMAGALEIGKLVIASFLYRYWNSVGRVMKFYFTISTVVLVIITSSGIFGYLSNAYAQTSTDIKAIEARVQVLNSKKDLILSEKNRNETRINELNNLRNNQENRIAGANNVSVTKRLEMSSNNITNQISRLSGKADSLDNQLSVIDNKILEEQSKTSSSDVGPLKYIAVAFGTDIDTVVKFFILILIFVFDPLAVSLIIAFNIVLKKEQESKQVINTIVSESIPDSTNEIEPLEIDENEWISPEEIKQNKKEEQVIEPIIENKNVDEIKEVKSEESTNEITNGEESKKDAHEYYHGAINYDKTPLWKTANLKM